jgi:hypothetical protein
MLAVADCDGCGAMAWSPDGAWLVYDTRGGLRALETGSGLTRALTTSAGDRWPACSPDGRWLAYQHGPNNDGGIVAVAARDCLPLTGADAQARYLNGYFPAWRPSWSFNGALLTFASGGAGKYGVVRVTRLSDLASAPDLTAYTPAFALSQAGCDDPTWALSATTDIELPVFSCDGSGLSRQRGILAALLFPGALAPMDWRAITTAGTFQGTCWIAT